MAFAAAAATWISSISISESFSPLGVPVLISGARTVMLESEPGRFSFPPTNGGRTTGTALPVLAESSGVSEPLRDSATVGARCRFCPARDFGTVADFGAAADCFFSFFGGSGCGHSTSCVRSMREGGTHSVVD